MFGQRKQNPLSTDDVRRLGRMEAAVETLELKWEGYRDELKKLVNRLEKRDERLLKKLAQLDNNDVSDNIDAPGGNGNDILRRIAARRGS